MIAVPAADQGRVPKPPNHRREYWITLVGSTLLRLLVFTIRFRMAEPDRLATLQADDPLILVFWHNRILMVPIAWNRFFSGRSRKQGSAMTSTSRDGELIAQFLGRFHIGHVRGSATRQGSAALRALVRLLGRGHVVAITPDGSRGPIYEVKGGLILLAQLTGQPMLPISFEFSNAWRLKGWDRFFIPKPFSTVTLLVGDLYHAVKTSNEQEFERERLRCQEAMMALVRER